MSAMRSIDTAAKLTVALALALATAGCAGLHTAGRQPAPPQKPARSAAPANGGTGGTLRSLAGNLAGAWPNSAAAAALDARDRDKMQAAVQNALEKNAPGATSSWANPATGHAGTVTPQKAYRGRDGQTCREYHQTLSVDGQTKTGYGAACRHSDGTWRIARRA